MARPKPRRSAETTPPVPKKGSFRKAALWAIASMVAFLGLWGIFKAGMKGPTTPLPRAGADFKLGASWDEVAALWPSLTPRPYNNDPEFRIASLKAPAQMPPGLVNLDLIFYKGTLFFISQQWLGPDPHRDLDRWAHQFRRWAKKDGGQNQPLGGDVTLREWSFRDPSTEMLLRELRFQNKVQCWQDLRDAANAQAMSAFEKYRIDG